MIGILIRHRVMVGFGRMRPVLSVVIQELGGLAISLFEDRIVAKFGVEITDDCQNLGTVDIPMPLILTAVAYAKAAGDLYKVKNEFSKLMEG